MHDLLHYLHELLQGWILAWFGMVKAWGYPGVVLLMAMESSIFPVPSEIVVPPAAFLAEQGHMSFWGVVAAGTLGSYLGSAITYWLSAWLGRIVILKWGKFFFVSAQKLERAEHFVHRYEAGGIFFARLLPVVRHLISIPAGIIRMPFKMFSAMTITGSFIWCFTLAYLGRGLAKSNPGLLDNPTGLMDAIKNETWPIFLGAAVFCALYVLAMRLTKPKETPAV